MKRYWEFVRDKNEFLKEAIEQQRERIFNVLKGKFPEQNDNFVNSILSTLIEFESQIDDEEDRRKSATINKFLRDLKANPGESQAHTLDRIRKQLTDLVFKTNSKGHKDRTSAIRSYLKTQLPDENDKVLETLLQQVLKGARPQDVVNAYLSQKRAMSSHDRVVAKQGVYEMIEINVWREEEGLTDKHLETGNIEACHPLLKGTKWCTRFKDYFDDYTKSGPLYLVRKNGKPFVLGHIDSLWLDVNDNIPDMKEMEPCAKFIMDSGVEDAAYNAVFFLANPVQDLHRYSGKYNDKALQAQLLGEYYTYIPETETVVIDFYDDISKALYDLSVRSHEKVNIVNIDELDETISQMIYDLNFGSEELVGRLYNKVEDRLIEIMEKRYREGEYGNVDGWEDMGAHEVLDMDDDLRDVLRTCMETAYRDSTYLRALNRIKRDMTTADENGFYMEEEDGTWSLCIKAFHVNQYAKSTLGDIINQTKTGLIDTISIGVGEPDIDFDFDVESYNKMVMEELEGVS